MNQADTTPPARARQQESFRRMAPERRVALAIEMSEEIRAVTEAGVRHRHPAWSDDEVRDAVAAIMLGRELPGRSKPRSTPAGR